MTLCILHISCLKITSLVKNASDFGQVSVSIKLALEAVEVSEIFFWSDPAIVPMSILHKMQKVSFFLSLYAKQ